ncbi:hypothetical protein Q9R19_09055 [Microbacterium sp. ARD32]|uniref:hypothetical protein n=1 Tax=Microbacterium sp. ARD32 TaxID=2962577 RepID=UPI00288229BC|nr:hypothetical protein [Microbacterium sp. ARD32]MDT0157771.1 hypothetical protein [Microbacterium sp. ARD32]
MTLPRPARSGTWTRGTIVLLIVCAVLACAAIATAALLPGHVRDGVRRDAEATARAFLDGATAIDASWRDAAGPMLQGMVPLGAPLAGERGTARALRLTVEYDLGELTFDAESLERSDTASAIATITYRYTMQGAEGTASIAQKLWLTRPFYYGDGTPQQARPGRQAPSRVGPWRVAGLTVPDAEDDAPSTSRLSLRSEPRDADGLACYTAASALEELADHARIDGRLASSCFPDGADAADVVDPQVDTADLLAVLPAIDRTDPASLPPELTRLDTNAFGSLRAPFTEFLIAERYVVVLAAASTGEGRQAVRLVGIREAVEKR